LDVHILKEKAIMKGSSSSLSVLKILCVHADGEFVAILLNTYLGCPLVAISVGTWQVHASS